MNNQIRKLLTITIILSINFISCKNDSYCSEFSSEKYLSENTNLGDSTKIQIKNAYKKFEESEELNTEFESYRMIYSHSMSSITNLWIFEEKLKGGILTYKEYDYDDDTKSPILKENSILELSTKDWQHVIYLINNFNFWTTKEYKKENVAGGGGYIIEGYRPGAIKCNKLERKLVLRIGSSNIDEINWLCSDLISVYNHKSHK